MQDNTIIIPRATQGARGPVTERSEVGACRPINKVDRVAGSGLAAALAMTARARLAQEKRERVAGLVAERPNRLVRHARAQGREGPARRYAVTVASADNHMVIDTARARVERARRRMSVWASIVPKTIEVQKRKKLEIEAPRLVMVTLTYADGSAWRANDIREYMLSLRYALKSRLIGYAWVLEMQKRGAPHYHIMLYVRRGTRVPTPDKSGMWKKGVSRIETAQRVDYIMRYVGKEYQKEMLPGGARMFAVWINKNIPTELQLLLFRASSLPGWFRSIVTEYVKQPGAEFAGLWKRAPGGGWLLKPTGEVHLSPWRLIAIERIYGVGLA